MYMKFQWFDTTKLCEVFNTDGAACISEEVVINEGWCGEFNPFYGKTHNDETKDIISKKSIEYHKNNPFITANYGEKNGMYGSERFGELNPMFGKTHSEDARKKMRKPHRGPKEFNFISPSGEKVTINNLTQWCLKNNHNACKMGRLHNGHINQYKGWKCA